MLNPKYLKDNRLGRVEWDRPNLYQTSDRGKKSMLQILFGRPLTVGLQIRKSYMLSHTKSAQKAHMPFSFMLIQAERIVSPFATGCYKVRYNQQGKE